MVRLVAGLERVLIVGVLTIARVCLRVCLCSLLQGMGHHSSDEELKDLMDWMAKCLQA
jgi:hypothetical protein